MPHLGDAYSLARWITSNGADAEDVVQDACLRAFRAVGGVADDSARRWLLTIVRNTAYTWLRKNRPSTVLLFDDLDSVEAKQAIAGDVDCEEPETKLIAKVDAAGLKAAIVALPALYRETIILRDVQELSYREIAEVTGVPIGTVMSRLARARRRLITVLASNDITHMCTENLNSDIVVTASAAQRRSFDFAAVCVRARCARHAAAAHTPLRTQVIMTQVIK